MHYNIASYAVPTNYVGELHIDSNDVVDDEVTISSEAHVSDVVMKSKTDATTDWYRLQDSSNVQNMRLHIFVVRREWDNTVLKWVLTRNKLTMDPESYWNMTLKFVQQF